MPPKGGQSSDVGSGTRGSVDKCKEHKSILTTTDIDYLSGSVTPQCFEIVRRGQKQYRLLTCLNPRYMVRISDLVNFVSANRSFNCTVFLFLWANLCLTASWMSMPKSSNPPISSDSPPDCCFSFFVIFSCPSEWYTPNPVSDLKRNIQSCLKKFQWG